MNKRGLALILSYIVITVLIILGGVFSVRSISESGIAQRYAESTQAFWLAEAGVAQALTQLNDFSNLNSIASTSQYSVDTIVVEGSNRRVTAHGFVPSAAAPRVERRITVLAQNSGGSNPSNPSLITYAIETSGTLKIEGKNVDINPEGSSHAGSSLTFEQVFGMTLDQMKAIAVSAQASGTGHFYTDPDENQQPVNGITWVELTGSNKYKISSEWSGSGLLIVNSNGNDVALDISSKWSFTGMIWVTGRFKITGGTIDGAIFARSSIDAQSSLDGKPTLNLNSTAVADAFRLLGTGGTGGVEVLSWQEI